MHPKAQEILVVFSTCWSRSAVISGSSSEPSSHISSSVTPTPPPPPVCPVGEWWSMVEWLARQASVSNGGLTYRKGMSIRLDGPWIDPLTGMELTFNWVCISLNKTNNKKTPHGLLDELFSTSGLLSTQINLIIFCARWVFVSNFILKYVCWCVSVYVCDVCLERKARGAKGQMADQRLSVNTSSWVTRMQHRMSTVS